MYVCYSNFQFFANFDFPIYWLTFQCGKYGILLSIENNFVKVLNELISYNFGEKLARVNYCNFHTVLPLQACYGVPIPTFSVIFHLCRKLENVYITSQT